MKKLNMNKTTRKNYLTYGLVIVAFVIIQIFMGAIPATLKGMLVPICAYVIMAISLNLTVGVLGELSLGHAGFMLVGAYASALFTKNVGMPPNKFRQNYIVSTGIEEKPKRKRK